ncbi:MULTISPECIES: MarR family winged helix-turn-helix transcriptional regulator [Bacillus]|jgi:DNA-binding MarR family transcriptional regulator|uniref:MarR family transcriptional regulator n=7 Tax=Bacillus cereus group TaxID=86661 RepID=A1BZR7_BACCE|nr:MULTISPECIES: MarR family winged helix-turn-helix transcriptional regulator [Bacillus]AAS45022.1 transcriptional regulator, MarR family protein [Bacillus cereus ATCC 10987]EEK75746.1 Transcriptional regulator, MarR [Bacillus cereus R309803]KXY85031.1 MarR family transcriptional regulator [Bacillus wiedmannii]MBL1703543.1 MarR family transcriptional regulator [Klebsiella pneumoniae]MCO4219720.1 MarR family winged helix-turn-helix transcriptional regulator [Bacillus sp. 10017]MDV8113552.1 Ma
MTDILGYKKEAYQLRQMLQILIRRFGLLEKEGAQCCGVSLIQSHILFEVQRQKNPSLNELASSLGLDNSTLSRHIQGLVNKDLVERTQSPTDRRYLSITLTPEGEKYENEIGKQMNTYIEEILSNVPKEKRMQVLESIDLILEAMQRSSCC